MARPDSKVRRETIWKALVFVTFWTFASSLVVLLVLLYAGRLLV
jgi:hypothetical protein